MATTSLTQLVYIDDTGYHFADYPSFLSWLQLQYQSIYGEDIYIEADSQDGQFLAILAQAFYDCAALGASVYNSFSPSSAQGVGLSRLVKINGIQRQSATYSTVVLTITGTAGTVITNGIAQDVLGQNWLLPSPTTIPVGGSINVTATAQTVGAINAQMNTVTTIFTPTLGWQTVNNSAAAILGAPIETDGQLRVRQGVSVANPSNTVLVGTQGAVSNVTGVTLVKAYENDTDATDSNTLPPHSISLIVAGGADIDVANAIALHKTPGTNTYGTTTVNVTDSKGMPLAIKFYRPTVVTIGVQLTISPGTTWSADYKALIQTAVSNYLLTLGIGNEVFLSRIYAPAYLNGASQGQSYTITQILMQKNGGSFSGSDIPIAFNEQVFSSPANVFFVGV